MITKKFLDGVDVAKIFPNPIQQESPYSQF